LWRIWGGAKKVDVEVSAGKVEVQDLVELREKCGDIIWDISPLSSGVRRMEAVEGKMTMG
jgi:hypothetical protein